MSATRQIDIGRFAWDREGTFGMMARRIPDGREIFAGDPDRLFQLASVFKVPILSALEALAETNDISWRDRYVLTDEEKSPGSGILVDMESGLSLSTVGTPKGASEAGLQAADHKVCQ